MRDARVEDAQSKLPRSSATRFGNPTQQGWALASTVCPFFRPTGVLLVRALEAADRSDGAPSTQGHKPRTRGHW